MTRRRPIDRHSAWLYRQPERRSWWTGRRAARSRRWRRLSGDLDRQRALIYGYPYAASVSACHAAERLVRDALAWYKLAALRVRLVNELQPGNPLTSPRTIAAEIASAGGPDRYLAAAAAGARTALVSLRQAILAEQAASPRRW